VSVKQRNQGGLPLFVVMSSVLAMVWLMRQTHYRDQLVAQVGGKPSIIDVLSHSLQLLQRGDPYEIGLFVTLWGPLVFLIVYGAWILAKYRRKASL
jgi:hypothetical protein